MMLNIRSTSKCKFQHLEVERVYMSQINKASMGNTLQFINKLTSLTLFLTVLASLMMASGCDDASQLRKSSLIYCIESAPSHFNPQRMIEDTELEATSRHLYDRLLELDSNFQLIPSLAKSWEILDKGKRYRLNLQKNVEFHHTDYFKPTRHFNSEDVIFSFGRITEGLHPFHLSSGGSYPFFQATGFSRLVKAISKVDDYTIDFILYHPNPSFLANLAAEYAVIHSKEYGEQLIKQGLRPLIDTLPIGTGPFKFNLRTNQQSLVYDRHNNYWQGPVKFERLFLEITPSASSRLAQLMTRECDLMSSPGATQKKVIEDQKQLKILTQAQSNLSYLAFNTQHPPLDKLSVRKAIAMAINKKQLLKTVYFNDGRIASQVLPQATHKEGGNTKQMAHTTANLKAKATLTAYGLNKLPTLTLYVDKAPKQFNPSPLKMAQIIKYNLADVGIKLDIKVFDRHILTKELPYAEYDLLLTGWEADTIDKDSFFRQQFSCAARFGSYNFSRYCDNNFDLILNAAIGDINEEQRERLYNKLQFKLAELVPIVPLVHTNKLYAVHEDLNNLTTTPLGGISFISTSRQ